MAKPIMSSSLGENGTFVLGPGRCGSTMVSDILNLHPDILSLSEFFSMQGVRSLLPGELTGKAYWKQLSTQTRSMKVMFTPETAPSEFLYNDKIGRFPIDDVPPILVSTIPHLTKDPDALFDRLAVIVPTFPVQTVERHHELLFQTLGDMLGRRLWVERTGLSQMYAKLLPKLYPKAKFVLLYRDGRDVALSMQAFKPTRPAIWNWKWNRRFGRSPIDIDDPAGRSRKLYRNDRLMGWKPIIRWMVNHAPPLEDCVGFWSELTLTSLPEFLSIPSERRHILAYENLTRKPEAEISKLASFLGANRNADWLKKAAQIPRVTEPRWKRLDSSTQSSLRDWTLNARKAAASLSAG
ncbi:MAG: sulfotransferase [Pseudomonadota bacterium]